MALRILTLPRRPVSALFLSACLVFPSMGTAQTTPQVAIAQLPAPERLQPYVDLAQFQDANHANYLDLSYAVPLPAAPTSSPDDLALVLDLRIYRNDSLWATKVWKLEEKKSALMPAQSRRELVDRVRYTLSVPGTYRAVLCTRSLETVARVDSAVAILHTRRFAEHELEISDVILASEIKKAAPASVASRQSAYEIFPNPRLIYGEIVPTLYYYFEAYNIASLPGDHYKLYWRVEHENGGGVEDLAPGYRTKKKLNDFSIELGTVPVATLPSGAYVFVYGIADSAQHLHASRRKKFYIYNSTIASSAVATSGAATLLPNASAAELDDEFDRMQHIVPRDEKKMYQSLTNAEGKRKFILSLWEAHKPEEYPNGLAYRRVYLARAGEADVKFPTVFRPGWKSDQGRVFILYGPPSNIEREPSNPTTKPYEIWRYDEIQGGVIFVFADRTGFKNYELIHSTHRNELHNPDWQRLVTFELDREGMQ